MKYFKKHQLLSVLRKIVADAPEAGNLKTLSQLKAEIPKLLKAAQKQYDEWDQDEDGYDHEVGSGGIYHLIVDAMLDVLNDFDATSLSLDSEVHVIGIVKLEEGVFELDVPYSLYEKGGGYTWKKIPNVVFEPSDIVISRISSDPEDFDEYTKEY